MLQSQAKIKLCVRFIYIYIYMQYIRRKLKCPKQSIYNLVGCQKTQRTAVLFPDYQVNHSSASDATYWRTWVVLAESMKNIWMQSSKWTHRLVWFLCSVHEKKSPGQFLIRMLRYSVYIDKLNFCCEGNIPKRKILSWFVVSCLRGKC